MGDFADHSHLGVNNAPHEQHTGLQTYSPCFDVCPVSCLPVLEGQEDTTPLKCAIRVRSGSRQYASCEIHADQPEGTDMPNRCPAFLR